MLFTPKNWQLILLFSKFVPFHANIAQYDVTLVWPSGMDDLFGPKVGQIGPKCRTNPGPFQIIHNVLKFDMKKSQICPISGQSDRIWGQAWHPSKRQTKTTTIEWRNLVTALPFILTLTECWRHGSGAVAGFPHVITAWVKNRTSELKTSPRTVSLRTGYSGVSVSWSW